MVAVGIRSTQQIIQDKAQDPNIHLDLRGIYPILTTFVLMTTS
jgi:hypothetical protein